MTLSKYHKKYSNQLDSEINNRVAEKESELIQILSKVHISQRHKTLKVAVLGCGDKRYISAHSILFEKLFKRPVQVITFDISIEHLMGEDNVFQHDCTQPLPYAPFDIIFSHVLLKFIETEKQWDLIKNSFESLSPDGLAIHIMNDEDYKTEDALLSNGQFAVPIKKWIEKLDNNNIRYKQIDLKFGSALVLIKTL